MTQPMEKEAMLAALRDIHLPAAASGGPLADLFAAAGVAGALVLVGSLALRAFTARRVAPRAPGLAEQMAALDTLPEDRRRTALLALLKTRRADRFAALRPRLYQPHNPPSSDEVAKELLSD